MSHPPFCVCVECDLDAIESIGRQYDRTAVDLMMKDARFMARNERSMNLVSMYVYVPDAVKERAYKELCFVFPMPEFKDADGIPSSHWTSLCSEYAAKVRKLLLELPR